MEEVRNQETLIASLPPAPRDTGLAADIVRGQKAGLVPILVVLDDDPTGTQTCHGVNILTVWDHDILVAEFKSTSRGFFILTNSRALPTAEARQLIKSICEAVKRAAAATEKDFEVVLRGDSTLRGHFPDEPEVAEDVLGQVDGWVLAPFFQQGGRLTIDDVHYVAERGQLIPAAQTPFAEDATFGYRHSNLRQYVTEKSKGRIPEDRIISVSIDDIRLGGPSRVHEKLMGSKTKSTIVIVNAVVDEDMEVFLQGLLIARSQGKRYLYRTGACFVSTRLGIPQIPPLALQDLGEDLAPNGTGGLIIAGSYVPKTTAQLQSLIQGRGDKLNTIVLQVEDLLGRPEKSQATILAAADKAANLIVKGEDILLMTSRKLITAGDEEASLKIGSVVAAALVDFLRMLNPRPRYIIAKGGITSSDAASKSLRMKRAEIVGQAASGVPLWRCYEETSKFPGLPYVVFPGNVGQTDALRDLVASWSLPSPPPSPQANPMQYQRLGRSALKISRIVLGCMLFGSPSWEGSPWTLPASTALPLLKRAYDLGITTWDTADTYSNGASEIIIGDALQHYSIPRERIVVMTKLYYPVDTVSPNTRVANHDPYSPAYANQMGLSRKHIFAAVDASLARLRTGYIDVLQLHRLDRDADPTEIMGALHDLVKMGKVHYLGASSMRAWEFARLQYTAKMHGWTPFSSMQGLYNLVYREEEREMNPFCEAEGVGLLPWSPLARGLLARPYGTVTARGEKDEKTKGWFGESEEQNRVIVERVQQVAGRLGCAMSSVALAWLLRKGCAPVVGLGSEERMEAALEAFEVEGRLGAREMRDLEETYRPLRVQAM